MGCSTSKPRTVSVQEAPPSTPRLWITGLGSQYPAYAPTADMLDRVAAQFYDMSNPGLKKLLQINRNTGIATRSMVHQYESSSGFAMQSTPPTIADIDTEFRRVGVPLAVGACKKALNEWGGDWASITHTIAVTCTNQGNPGFDLLVVQHLGLSNSVERTLLHGVGCAGGLSILRAAAQIADSAASRGLPARILCFACEVCSLSVRFELEEACRCDPANVNIATALFSDGAAAFVVCNEYGRGKDDKALFEVLGWGCDTIPDSNQHMGFYAKSNGYKSSLSREIPSLTSMAIKPMFYKLLPSVQRQTPGQNLEISDFDWAMHPGGGAILKAASKLLDIPESELWASWEIYKTKGNSSSPTVLCVLDRMREKGPGRDHVVATSFGPGLMIEMAMLRRWRPEEGPKPVARKRWLGFVGRGIGRKGSSVKEISDMRISGKDFS